MATGKLRQLKFETFDDLKQDVETLLASGYEVGGNWNLAQVSKHLNDFLSFPMDGFPKTPFPISLALTLIRVTSGRRLMQNMFKSGEMPSGKPTIPSTVYNASDAEDASAVRQFLKTIDRFSNFKGTPVPSPVFGPMSYEEAARLQLLHCSHHLSFLKPRQ